MATETKQVNYRFPVDLVDALKAASAGHKSESEFVIKTLRRACGLDNGGVMQDVAPVKQAAIPAAPSYTLNDQRKAGYAGGHKPGCRCLMCNPPKDTKDKD